MIKIFENNFNDKKYAPRIFSNPKVFDINEVEIDEFDKNFDYREKKVIEGQLI